MIYFCCTDLRRDAVKQSPNLNGIDFLEVLDRSGAAEQPAPAQTVRSFFEAARDQPAEKGKYPNRGRRTHPQHWRCEHQRERGNSYGRGEQTRRFFALHAAPGQGCVIHRS